MGDRIAIQFIDAQDATGVCVYLHWHGGLAIGWLEQAAPLMRKGDCSYAAARFIGFCHERISGGLSLGVYNSPFDPGDNGLLVVDCSKGRVSRHRASEANPGKFTRAGSSFDIQLGSF